MIEGAIVLSGEKIAARAYLDPDRLRVILDNDKELIIPRNYILMIREFCDTHISQYGAIDYNGNELKGE